MKSTLTFVLVAACLIGCASQVGAAAAPLEPVQSIPLPQVQGKFDPLAIDLAGQRLVLAAKINNTLEAVDLKAGRHALSLRGIDEPQGVLFLPDTKQVVVANVGDGEMQLFDGTSLEVVRYFGFGDDTDNLRYDPATKRIDVACRDGSQELYDHDNDSEENHDVAKSNPAIVAELSAQLKTLPPYHPNP